jgi:hypothetical protein
LKHVGSLEPLALETFDGHERGGLAVASMCCEDLAYAPFPEELD